MTIKLLSRETAEKIAAGEVIERPASVIKELLENSIDAGATRVDIEIIRGGKEYLKITDNGVGIAFSQLPTAFLRHATSKISEIDDLEKLTSLGFRGEALPSIAAVSRIKMISKPKEQLTAGEIIFNGGSQIEYQECASRDGTTVIVEELFFNTPARLKFLKSDSYEASIINEIISEYALGNPHIAFSLVSDGKRVLHTSGSSDLREALAEIWGKNIASLLIEREEFVESEIILKGFVSPFEIHRSSRKQQIFFVNGRLVKNPMLHAALEEPYKGILPHRKHPIALVYISLPAEDIDVNVHPAKTLIKFRDERKAFLTVRNFANNALMRPNTILKDTTIKEETAVTQEPIKYHQETVKDFNPGYSYNKFVSELPFFKKEEVQDKIILEKSPQLFPKLRYCGVFRNSYILAENEESLYLIDQHAAHERILYEKILNSMDSQSSYSQTLLEPLVIELPGNTEIIINSIFPVLTKMGFEISHFGDITYLIRAVPTYFSNKNIADELDEIISEILSSDSKVTNYKASLAAKLACKGAVNLNLKLNHEEIVSLLSDLAACEEPFRCPHGRPVLVDISDYQIQKWFKRVL